MNTSAALCKSPKNQPLVWTEREGKKGRDTEVVDEVHSWHLLHIPLEEMFQLFLTRHHQLRRTTTKGTTSADIHSGTGSELFVHCICDSGATSRKQEPQSKNSIRES